jgi:hypothetical protein
MIDAGCPNIIHEYWLPGDEFEFWITDGYVHFTATDKVERRDSPHKCGCKEATVLEEGIFTADMGLDPHGKLVMCKKCGFTYYKFPAMPTCKTGEDAVCP